RTLVWNVAARRLRELTSPALTHPTSLHWSSSGLVAWADLQSGVRGWDDRVGRPVDFGRATDSAVGLAFRPDGARLAVAGLSSVSIVDVVKRRAVGSREFDLGSETGIAFSPDGSRLAFSSSSSEGFAMFDGNLRSVRRIAALERYTNVEAVAFSPDGRWIAAGI